MRLISEPRHFFKRNRASRSSAFNKFHTGNLKNPVPCLSQMAAFMEQCFLGEVALNGNAASPFRKGPSTALCKAEIYWAKFSTNIAVDFRYIFF